MKQVKCKSLKPGTSAEGWVNNSVDFGLDSAFFRKLYALCKPNRSFCRIPKLEILKVKYYCRNTFETAPFAGFAGLCLPISLHFFIITQFLHKFQQFAKLRLHGICVYGPIIRGRLVWYEGLSTGPLASVAL